MEHPQHGPDRPGGLPVSLTFLATLRGRSPMGRVARHGALAVDYAGVGRHGHLAYAPFCQRGRAKPDTLCRKYPRSIIVDTMRASGSGGSGRIGSHG